MAKYGLLYTWQATMNGAGSSDNNPSGIQGICPSGWHVPSNSEWCELENYIEPGIDVKHRPVRGRWPKSWLHQRWTSIPKILRRGYLQNVTTALISAFSALGGILLL
jgi:uncharacterized protein (TIGR02145 family)